MNQESICISNLHEYLDASSLKIEIIATYAYAGDPRELLIEKDNETYQ